MMKITRKALREIVREELLRLTEVEKGSWNSSMEKTIKPDFSVHGNMDTVDEEKINKVDKR